MSWGHPPRPEAGEGLRESAPSQAGGEQPDLQGNRGRVSWSRCQGPAPSASTEVGIPGGGASSGAHPRMPARVKGACLSGANTGDLGPGPCRPPTRPRAKGRGHPCKTQCPRVSSAYHRGGPCSHLCLLSITCWLDVQLPSQTAEGLGQPSCSAQVTSWWWDHDRPQWMVRSPRGETKPGPMSLTQGWGQVTARSALKQGAHCPGDQHPHLETGQEGRTSDSPPDPLDQKFWGTAPESVIQLCVD